MSGRPSDANEGCVGPESSMAGKAAACAGCPNQKNCASGKGSVDPAAAEVARSFGMVKHTILVLSGKGGVGKSTVASQLAWGLSADTKLEVGVLDIDICGPSMPRMMGVEDEEVHKSGSGWSPVMADDNLAVMSVGFMLQKKTDAIIWRGPRKTGLIKQFLTDVDWGKLDFLVVDAPPGTSDEHISLAKFLKKVKIDGAIIVTTPQEVALLDVRKEITFCHKTKIPILGVVENMSYFSCPNCNHLTKIFPPLTGGAKKLCADTGIPYLGAIPMDSKLLDACENGESFLARYPKSPAVPAITSLVTAVQASDYSKLSGSFKEDDNEDMNIEEKKEDIMKSSKEVQAILAYLEGLQSAPEKTRKAAASDIKKIAKICAVLQKK
ncbi:hypothetical protein AAMO2058_000327200 [Amorphochlora amoebiformis]